MCDAGNQIHGRSASLRQSPLRSEPLRSEHASYWRDIVPKVHKTRRTGNNTSPPHPCALLPRCWPLAAAA